MPSFNGLPIFGRSPTIKTAINRPSRQENAFFGVNGKESLAGGTRGFVTIASGVLCGDTAGDLAAALGNFWALADGRSHVLIDSFGVAWPDVTLDSFEPDEPVRQDPTRGYFVRYSARFEHLRSPDDGGT